MTTQYHPTSHFIQPVTKPQQYHQTLWVLTFESEQAWILLVAAFGGELMALFAI
jgi:hypothetical protein